MIYELVKMLSFCLGFKYFLFQNNILVYEERWIIK